MSNPDKNVNQPIEKINASFHRIDVEQESGEITDADERIIEISDDESWDGQPTAAPVATSSNKLETGENAHNDTVHSNSTMLDESDVEGYVKGYYGEPAYDPKVHIESDYSQQVHGECDFSQKIDEDNELEKADGYSREPSHDRESTTEASSTFSPQEDIDDLEGSVNTNNSNASDDSSPLYNEVETAADTLKTYSAFLTALTVAYDLGDLEKIRNSHNKMREVFPISPDLWLRLIDTELSQDDINAEEMQQVDAIFKLALDDFYSMEIAIQYSEFALSYGTDRDWYSIISSYGYDVLHGSEIMKNYRIHVRSMEGLNPEPDLKIIKTYVEQLRVPQKDIDITYKDFSDFREEYRTPSMDEINKTCEELYRRSKGNVDLMHEFERQLAELPKKHYRKRAEIFLKYIDTVKDKVDYRVLQALYERLVAACHLNSACWMKYVDYLMTRDQDACPIDRNSIVFGQSWMDVLHRACLNCPFSPDLQMRRLRMAHHYNVDAKSVMEYTQHAHEATFRTAKGHVDFWQAHITYAHRIGKTPETIRALFQDAIDSLGKCNGDPCSEFARFAAEMECYQLENQENGYKWYERAMNNLNNRYRAGLWLEFAQSQLVADHDKARGVYERAAKVKNIDDFEAIQAAWKRYESVYGGPKEVAACHSKLDRIIETYERKMLKPKNANNEQDATKSSKRKTQSTVNEKADKKSKSKSPPSAADKAKQLKPKQRKQKKSKPEQQQQQQEPANTHDMDKVSVAMSNLPYSMTKDDIVAAFPELNIRNIIMKEKGGQSCGLAYVELSSEAEVALAVTFDRRPIDGRPAFITKILRDKNDRSEQAFAFNQKRVFVSGLPMDATVDELRREFESFGPITDITLIKGARQVFTGLAYINFATIEFALDAIKFSRNVDLRGQTLTVRPFEQIVRDEVKATIMAQAAAEEREASADRVQAPVVQPNNQCDVKPRTSVHVKPTAARRQTINQSRLSRSDPQPSTSKQ